MSVPVKFIVCIEPEFDETAEELMEIINESLFRGNNLYGYVLEVPDPEDEDETSE